MRAEGVFARVDLEVAERRLKRLEEQRDRLRQDLKAIMAEQERGKVEKAVRELALFLKRADVKRTIKMDKKSVSGSWSKFQKRQEAIAKIAKKHFSSREIMDIALNYRTPVYRNVYVDRIEALIERCRPARTEAALESLERDLPKAERRIELIKANLVTDWELERFVRAMTKEQRKIAARATREGVGHFYYDDPKDADLQDLISRGLIYKEDRHTYSTSLLCEIGDWIENNVTTYSRIGARKPCMKKSQVRAALDARQRKKLASRLKLILRDIKQTGESREMLEVGFPEDGISYRIARNRSAVRFVLQQVAVLKKIEMEDKGPSFKMPDIRPGRIIEEEEE